MMKYFLLAVAALAVPFAARAYNVSYGFIEAQRDDEVHIKYSGPEGEEHFACDITTVNCREFDPDEEVFRVADALSQMPLTVSADGRYAALPLTGSSPVRYAFITLEGALGVSLVPFESAAAAKKIAFSRDGENLVIAAGGSVYVYDTRAKTGRTLAASAGSYLSLVSPSSDYLTWRDDFGNQNLILNLSSGAITSVPSESASYTEISENGKWGVFREWGSDKQVLRLIPLGDAGGGRREASIIFSDAKAVDDYIFHKNRLYFTANSESPLMWSLFEYDPATGDTNEIDTNISYGDFMKGVGGALAYYKVVGRQSHAHVYDPENGDISVLSPNDADGDLSVSTDEITTAKRTAAVWETDHDEDERKPLVLWLHGGPQRQTSLGYHPYLSYGVYDELLERLANAGARVVKLDYMGSTGYGKKFQEGLTKKVGVADVADVKNAISDLKKKYKTDDVFLLGNSYGGYLALKALVEHPDDIDGVLSINGVSDWRGLIAQIPSSIFAADFGGAPGPATESYYAAADILSNIDEIDDDTPVGVAYAAGDTTIPPWQSETLIGALTEHDKNVESAKFEGEDHILRRRSTLDDLCKLAAETFDLKSDVCND